MKGILFENVHPFVRNAKRYQPDNKERPFAANYDNLFIYTLKNGSKIDADGKTYTMQRGDVLIIKPGVMYRFLPAEEKSSYILIDFDYTSRHKNVRFLNLYDKEEVFNKEKIIENIIINNVAPLNFNVYIKGTQLFEDKLIEIVNEISNHSAYSSIKSDALMMAVLADVVRALKLNASDYAANEKTIEEIIKYVDEHSCENLNNSTIGKMFALHPNYVNALVKERTGYTLHNYLLTRRLSKAIEILDTTALPIYEVSEKCGFSESKNFIRYFKKAIGITPHQYRKR